MKKLLCFYYIILYYIFEVLLFIFKKGREGMSGEVYLRDDLD